MLQALNNEKKTACCSAQRVEKIEFGSQKARLGRHLKMSVVADQAGISWETVAKIQKNNSGAGIPVVFRGLNLFFNAEIG